LNGIINKTKPTVYTVVLQVTTNMMVIMMTMTMMIGVVMVMG